MRGLCKQKLQQELTGYKREALLHATKRSPRALSVATPTAAGAMSSGAGSTASGFHGLQPSPRSTAAGIASFPSVASPRFSSAMASGEGGIAMLGAKPKQTPTSYQALAAGSNFFPSPSAGATGGAGNGQSKPPSRFQFSSSDVAQSSAAAPAPSLFSFGSWGAHGLSLGR